MEAELPVPPWRVIPAEVVARQPWRDPAAVSDSLCALYRSLAAAPFSGVAVRSSATLEDSRESSSAGVFDTVFADSPEGLRSALDTVAASAHALRAWSHLAAQALTRPEMAIIVQSRVAPRHAGVAFSADPSAANPGRCCVEAVSGVGVGLVDGSKAPSRFYLDVLSGRVAEAAPGSDGPQRLGREIAATLVDYLLRLEPALGGPVDVEWAADADRVWVLQARPITILHADASLRPPVCATSWFFDQRFAEPIRPLTRTALVPEVLRIGLLESLRMLHRPAPTTMVCDYYGQVYVAHAAYRWMLLGVPRWYLSEDLRQLFPEQCFCRPLSRGLVRFLGHWARYFVLASWAILTNWRESLCTLRAWRRFQRVLPGHLHALERCPPFSEQAWMAHWKTLERLAEACLRLHRWSLLWAAYAYRAFRIVVRLLPGKLRRRLEQTLESAVDLPTRRANAALTDILAGHTEGLDRFIRHFGHRSGSLDWAVPTWAELVKAGKLEDEYRFLAGTSSQNPERPARTGRVARALLHPLIRLIEMREEQRFEWERILAAQRRMLLEAGIGLARRGLLEKAEDAWFLEWDEFRAALFQSAAVQRDLVRARRHAWFVNSRIPKPAFIGLGAVPPPTSAAVLSGVAASPGRATGRAVVCQGPPTDLGDLDADTIIVAVSLDPAWTVLLTHVAGVVLERGGVLSHPAILAREYGVPMVTGVQDATTRLAPGTLLTIDGAAGRVTLAER